MDCCENSALVETYFLQEFLALKVANTETTNSSLVVDDNEAQSSFADSIEAKASQLYEQVSSSTLRLEDVGLSGSELLVPLSISKQHQQRLRVDRRLRLDFPELTCRVQSAQCHGIASPESQKILGLLFTSSAHLVHLKHGLDPYEAISDIVAFRQSAALEGEHASSQEDTTDLTGLLYTAEAHLVDASKKRR